MPRYIYQAEDVATGRPLLDLPLSGVKYSLSVNVAGPFSATMALEGTERPADLWDATLPGCSGLTIVRDGQPITGGIIWGQKPADDGYSSLSLDGEEWLSYLDHIYITDDLTYTQRDMAAVARSLVDYAQSKYMARIGLEFEDPTYTTGVLMDRTYLASEGATVLSRLLALTTLEHGLDLRTALAVSGSSVARRIKLGAPTLGRKYPDSGLEFIVGAGAWLPKVDLDGKSMGTVIYGMGGVPDGAPEGTAPPIVSVQDTYLGQTRWPRLERFHTWSDVTGDSSPAGQAAQLSRLRGQAAALLPILRTPVESGSIVVRGDSDPGLGTYWPGDEGLVIVPPGQVARWPNGLETVMRIASVDVEVPDDGDEERVTLTWAQPADRLDVAG